jgi:hypothetical protein
LIYAADPNEKQEKQTPVKINVEDLCSGKYVIIGRLRKPCGDIVKISGVWSEQDETTKPGWRLLQITHIDGKEIRPMTISERFVQPGTRSVKWPPQQGSHEGRVYERCGYIFGEPAKVKSSRHGPDFQHHYRFESYLYLID